MHNWTYFICPICAEPLSYLEVGSIGYINSQSGGGGKVKLTHFLCGTHLGKVKLTHGSTVPLS